MKLDNQAVFLNAPLSFANVWVKVVVPSFPALLTNATGKGLGHMSPILGTLSGDDASQNLIFISSPGALGKVRAVGEFEPPGVTFDL